MKKLEELQNRKMISAYGGSGSIIETLDNGSLLILPYDKWSCFDERNIDYINTIENQRLLAEVRRSYPAVERLVEIPTPNNLADRVYYANREDLSMTIKSEYFPRWFYCPNGNCRRLMKIEDWKEKWEQEFPNDNRFSKNPPACPYCSHANGNRISRSRLEQVRYVLASFDTGKLLDIPFDKIWNLPNDRRTWVLDNENATTEELRYSTSSGSDGLQAISIKKGNERKSMATIYNKYLVYQQGKKKGAYRVKFRNGSDIYFPNILSCIYIPKPTNEQVNNVIERYDDGWDANRIYEERGSRWKLSLQQIQDIIDNRGKNEDDVDFKMAEFFYITNRHNYNQRTNKRHEIDFKATFYPNLKNDFIGGFYALTQLKETSVLMSYSRVSNKPKKWLDSQTCIENPNMNPGEKLPFERIDDDHPSFMPAIDSYGEGILFEVNTDGIDGEDKLKFIHTYCHLIMKEMEFLCGYPVTSLKERIYYQDNDTPMGFLIYTIQGAEGSYGGLTSLMPNKSNSDGTNDNSRILAVINSATERAKDCTNDPICMHDGGHCFACVDLPETSCEMWNNDLDRRVFLKYINREQSSNGTVILDD